MPTTPTDCAPEIGLTTSGNWISGDALSFTRNADEESRNVSARLGASAGTFDSSKKVSYLSWSCLFPKTLSASAKNRAKKEISAALAAANTRGMAFAWHQSFWRRFGGIALAQSKSCADRFSAS